MGCRSSMPYLQGKSYHSYPEPNQSNSKYTAQLSATTFSPVYPFILLFHLSFCLVLINKLKLYAQDNQLLTLELLYRWKMRRCVHIFIFVILQNPNLYAVWILSMLIYNQVANGCFIFQSFYKENCFDGKLNKSLAFLPENLQRWSNADHRKCQVLWRKFHTMYNVAVSEVKSNFPSTFVSKVRDWLGGDDELMKEAYHQVR